MAIKRLSMCRKLAVRFFLPSIPKPASFSRLFSDDSNLVTKLQFLLSWFTTARNFFSFARSKRKKNCHRSCFILFFFPTWMHFSVTGHTRIMTWAALHYCIMRVHIPSMHHDLNRYLYSHFCICTMHWKRFSMSRTFVRYNGSTPCSIY